jgi:AcrR family transcriptional regulator
MKDRIIQTGCEAFFKYGVRSVPLDQLASELGISKKTIYQHFKDKDELVLAIVEFVMNAERLKADECYSQSQDPIHELIQASALMGEIMLSINPTLLMDLQKYHPKAWKVYLESKAGFLVDIERNLNDGIKLELYRSDLDISILSRMRLESVEMGLNQDFFPIKHFNVAEVNQAFLDHFIRGIVTEQGLKVYESHVQI